MKPKKTSLLSKILLSLLMVITVGLVLVGCTYKSNKTQEDLKTLEPISFSMLTKYSVKSNSTAATELYDNGEIKDAYSGALISSKISALHDKAKEYPTVQLWIDGKTENFYIEDTQENTQVTINNQGYRAYYLDASGNKQTGRATLVVDKTSSNEEYLRLVVHPNLTGSTSLYRTVRGKAIPAHGSVWKASAYSQALNIQVRKLTFVAYSYNSSDYNFADLSYSADLYPFSTATPTGATAFKFLEGYFVDGRVVCVTRTQTDKANYEVQCWTVDAPANNFVSLSSSSDTKLAGDTTTDNLALKGGTNILSATATSTISAWDESIKEQNGAFVYSKGTLQNSIFVRASSSTHKKTFYANYAKTNNFSISGRVFNADAISTINPKLIGLKGVVITVHDNTNFVQQITTEQYNALSESDKAKFKPIGDDKYLRIIEEYLTDANGSFEITNLSKDAYLTFYYKGDGNEDTGDNTELNTNGVEYRFVSAFFTTDGDTKVINLLSKDDSKTGPTDTENATVTASALPDESKLEVIINFINESTGSTNNSARYEYVTGITGETHYYTANGTICDESHNHDESTTCTAYTTTTVLVSVVPGKNNLVKSYSIETKNTGKLERYTLSAFSGEQSDSDIIITINGKNYKVTENSVVPNENYSLVNNFSIKITSNSGEETTFTTTSATITTSNQELSDTVWINSTENPTEMLSFLTNVNNALNNTSVRAEVYESEMKNDNGTPDDTNDDQPIYLYYSLAEGNYFVTDDNGTPDDTTDDITTKALFLTDPVGYADSKAEGGINFFPADTDGTALITNGQDLIRDGKIMSGENILKSTDESVVAFHNLIPAAIRENYYYYVAPICQTSAKRTAFLRVENVTDSINASDLSFLSNENLVIGEIDPSTSYTNNINNYLANDGSSKIFISSKNGNSVEIAKADNGKYYHIQQIAQISKIGEDSCIFQFGNLHLSSNVKAYNESNEETSNISEIAYFKSGDTIVAATGKYLNQNYTNFSLFCSALGIANQTEPNLDESVIYFVAALEKANVSSISNATVLNQYAYAFLKDDTADADQSTLTRSQIAANGKAIFVLGKTMASSTGFNTINALTPSGASKPIYTNNDSIVAALQSAGISINTQNSSVSTGKPYSIYIDQTISGSEVQGALGMAYLSGTPYPNPVFRFVVRHKRDAAQITLNVNLDQIYYVEALGTLAERETSDVIVDFSTFTFREEIQNILNNSTRYMPKQTTILTKTGLFELALPQLNPIAGSSNYALSFLRLAVEDFATYYNDSNIYYTGSNNKILSFCDSVQTPNKGYKLYTEFTKDDYTLLFDPLSGNWTVSDGNETRVLAASNAISDADASSIYSAINSKTAKTPANASDFVVWNSSSDAINDVAFFDIHTYNAEELQNNGNLELSSDCSDPCIGLLNLDESDILNPSNDYSEVAIAGTTSMYRILKSKANTSAGSPDGYYESTALFLESAENADDPFFYISTDAVVAIASPTVVISPDENDFTSNIYYRFKEWQVFKRFNSQIIQKCNSNEYSTSQNGTILYFAPQQTEDISSTGYYLLLPVYERLYSVSVATYSTDGTPNVGGSIGINSKSLFYTYTENQNHMILPLTKDYTIETTSVIDYVVIGQNIYYVVTDQNGTKTLVNTNGTFFADLVQNSEPDQQGNITYTAIMTDGTEIKDNDNNVLKLVIRTSKVSGTSFTKINPDGNEVGTIKIASKGQYMATRLTGYTATDKYGKQTTISTYVSKTDTAPNDGNYIDAEGNIYVSGMRIAQTISKDAYNFEGHKNAAYKVSTANSSLFDRLSPDTWLLDRHSLINLVAANANGYRFDGWYLVDKDTDTNTIIKSTQEAFTQSPTNYDVLSLPSNIYLLENGNYYKYELNYQNFAGKYEIKKVSVDVAAIPSNAFILYNGRLYNSTSIVSSNIVGSLSAYSESGVNYDNFIEYFYYQTEVIVPTDTTAYAVGSFIYENEQTTDLQTTEHGLVVGNCYNTITAGATPVSNGKYKVTSASGTQVSYTEKSTKLVTRILPYKYNSFGSVSKYAIHFVNTANLLEPLFSFVYVDNEGQVTGTTTGPNGMLSAYRGTEIFYDASLRQNDFFFLGQSTQNAATLVPTRVLTVKQNLVLEQTQSNPAEYTIFIDGIPYVIGSDIRATDANGNQISAPSSLDELKYIIFAYGQNNQESYEVYKNEDGTYYIIRYYLYVQNNNYQKEVFDYNEDAQTYVTHDHTIAVNERTGNVEDGSNWQTLNALQQPKVDFVLNQISAVSISTKQPMPTHYQTSEVSDDVYTLEIGDYTLKITENTDNSYNIVAYKTDDAQNKNEYTHTNNTDGTITAVVVQNTTVIKITRIDDVSDVLHVYCKADSYELSSTVLYETNGLFYRSRTEGNIVVNSNSVRINSLGSNLLLVAVFQPYYHVYAQTDNDGGSEASIEITGMFYFNKQDNSKAIRTKQGKVVSDYDVSTISLKPNDADKNYENYTSEGGLFGYKAEVGGGYKTLSLTIKTSFQTEDFVVNDATYYATVNTTKQTLIKNHGNLDVTNLLSLHKKSGEDQTITIDYAKIEKYQLIVKLSYIPSGSSESVSKTLTVSTDYTYDSYYDADFLGALANGGYSISDGNNPGHAVPIAQAQNHYLDFDAGTSLIVVVRCGKGANLTTSSLGLKNIGNLEFLMRPTDEALRKTDIKYYFYVLKIDLEPTYQNTYLEALTHPYNKTMLLRDLSTRAVYKDDAGKFFFAKEAKQHRENHTNNVITDGYKYSYPLTTTSTAQNGNGAQTDFVAQVSVGSVIRYYYVPSGNLSDLKNIEGAADEDGNLLETTVWANSESESQAQANKDPLIVTYYKHDSKAENRTEITTNAADLKQLINGETIGETKLSIQNGYPTNYLNLTSVEIYQFDIFALSLPFGKTIEDYDFTKQNSLDLDKKQPINFDASTILWAAGGRQINGEWTRIVTLETQGTKTKTKLGKTYDKYTISTEDYVSNGIMQPLSLVVDTLLTLSRPTKEYNYFDTDTAKYIFAGWYQIKQTGTNEAGSPIWGAPTYLGGEEEVSPVVADANTIVIALYKEVKYTSITLDTTKVMFESSTPIDMLGNSIVTKAPTVENDYQITLGGYFTSDFSWGIRLTPVAGNRLKSTTAIPFEGDLTGTKTILFGTNDDLSKQIYGAEYGYKYTVETVQTTTVLVRIENFDEIAQVEHTVTITDEYGPTKPNAAPNYIYFSTNFLNIINNVIDVVTINRTQYQILADNSDINNPIYYADINGNKIYDSEIDQIAIKDTDHNFYYIDTNEDNEYNAVENKSIKIHKYTYSLGTDYTAATKDSTGNYFSAMIVVGEETEPIDSITDYYTSGSRELLVALTLDRGTTIQLNHSIEEVDDDEYQTNFVGWKKNGNSQQNSSELYQDELTETYGIYGAVEYSAIIEQIQALTFDCKIEGIEEGIEEDQYNAFESAIKAKLKDKLELVYTAERYTLDGRIYTIVSTDTNKTLTYSDKLDIFDTFYFSHNSNLSFSIPGLNNIIEVNGQHFALVGYRNDTDSTLTHSAGYTHNITKPTTITLIFAPTSSLTISSKSYNDATCSFTATDSEFIEEFIEGARLIHGQKITLTASSLSQGAVIECYKIQIGTEPEFVVTTSGEKINGIGKVTYTISESSITLSYSGAETSITITAVANTGVIIN